LVLEAPAELSRADLLAFRPVVGGDSAAWDREDTRRQPTGKLRRWAEILRRAEEAGVAAGAELHLTPWGNWLFAPEPQGFSLAERMAAGGACGTAHQVLRTMISIGAAVAALHEAGVLHLGLDLSHIHQVGSQVRLSGFWRAQWASEAVADHRVTEGFSAPEQYRAGQVPLDERTDVFALGMILCSLLRGSTEPWPLAEQMWTLPEPDPAWDGLRRELYRIARRAAAFQPEERFSSATEFQEALQTLRERWQLWTEVRLTYSAATDLGLSRDNNEDVVLALSREVVDESGRQLVGLFAVADGMGGHRRGEVASALAVQTLSQQAVREFLLGSPRVPLSSAEVEQFLHQTIALANERLAQMGIQDATARGLGTTLTAGLLLGETLFLQHIGDSRAYLWRDGQLQRLTRDDSWVQWMVEQGQISSEEAWGHPWSHQLLAALDGQPERRAAFSTVEVQRGDGLLFCSDGLSGFLRDEEIAAILEQGGTAAERVQSLIEHVKARQRAQESLASQSDNLSVVWVQIE
jgi:serine/threonine protein phosphatase PrpC